MAFLITNWCHLKPIITDYVTWRYYFSIQGASIATIMIYIPHLIHQTVKERPANIVMNYTLTSRIILMFAGANEVAQRLSGLHFADIDIQSQAQAIYLYYNTIHFCKIAFSTFDNRLLS